MWRDAIGWLIAMIGLAVSAGWVGSAQTRSLHRLKAEAELLNLLPDSPSKDALLRQLNDDVEAYTWLKQAGPLRRLALFMWSSMAAGALVVASALAITVWTLVHHEFRWSVYFLMGALATVPYLLWVVLRQRLDRALEERREAAIEAPPD
jgi:hypothetical protein